jgi:hypothetical protein
MTYLICSILALFVLIQSYRLRSCSRDCDFLNNRHLEDLERIDNLRR